MCVVHYVYTDRVAFQSGHVRANSLSCKTNIRNHVLSSSSLCHDIGHMLDNCLFGQSHTAIDLDL